MLGWLYEMGVKLAIDDNDRFIVRSAVDLAHNIGLRVVAEGVENQAGWNLLAPCSAISLRASI